jgi:RNA methyltransferase, TrmH family
MYFHYNTYFQEIYAILKSMLTKGKIQALKSYADKKERNKKNIFLVEGEKSVAELLISDMIINELFITQEFSVKYANELKECGKRHALIEKWLKPQLVEAGEINKISTMESLKSETTAVAIVSQLEKLDLSVDDISHLLETEKVLMLDDIRDPGNMGTIIRLADWYGIKTIIASVGTVDIYNPKTISASMGSFSRVKVVYRDVNEILNIINKNRINVNIIASTLNGQNANDFKWPKSGALIIGNESNGINEIALNKIDNKITLPSLGKAESLNASVACGILLDRWTR